MYIEEVNCTKYDEITDPFVFYNCMKFNELNRHKVDNVRYFLFRDTKYRFGLCVGVTEDGISVPFSAPFASWTSVQKKWSIKQMQDAVKCLDDLAYHERWRQIRFVLPPSIYDGTLVSAMQHALIENGYSVCFQDLNYSLDLCKLYDATYANVLPANGRKNLRISLASGLSLLHCERTEEKQCAYAVIAINRKEKGYPLRMTWDDVLSTSKIVRHDFFLVQKDGVDIAAAQVFHVCLGIAQVIYWGDVPGYSAWKPMNYLAYELIKFYGERKVKYLDLGPSSESGKPNYGLCDFKRSIGCDINAKFTFKKVFVL